ncbi:MAG TPA: heavy-metal-associated domain-containing protein [Terracidiphilus sp.]|nr:heavy-metal-associated domain-containing protein [Terracidiphilus sp.]
MAEISFQIDGMHCGSCVHRVTQALEATEGIQVEEVRIGAARVQVGEDPAQVNRVIDAIAKAGYTAHLQR